MKKRDKTQRIVQEGVRLSRRKAIPKDWCSSTCASCLAAEARGNVDKKDRRSNKLGYCLLGVPAFFNSREDVCMLEARDILSKKLNYEIN